MVAPLGATPPTSPASATPTSTSCSTRGRLPPPRAGCSAVRPAGDEDGADRRRRHAPSSPRCARLAGLPEDAPLPDSRSRAPPGTRARSTPPTSPASASSSSATPPTPSPPPRVAQHEFGFTVVGLGTYSREFAREVRGSAANYGVEALITDDYLEVGSQGRSRTAAQAGAGHADGAPSPSAWGALRGHLGAGARAGLPRRAIRRRWGFGGANVLFDTWVHPLMMGLEGALLTMFRGDFEFHDGRRVAPRPVPRRPPPPGGAARRSRPARKLWWTPTTRHRLPCPGQRRRLKDPVLRPRQGPPQHRALRRRARPRHHHLETLYDAKAHFGRWPRRPVRRHRSTMDTRLAGAPPIARVAHRWRGRAARPRLSLHPPRLGASRSAPASPRPADIARPTSSSSACCSSTTISCPSSDLQAAATTCDAMVCCHVGRRGGSSSPGWARSTWKARQGPMALLSACGVQQDKAAAQGGAADEDAAPHPADAALHSRHRAGRARLFLTLQYWLDRGSDENIGNLVRHPGGPLRRQPARRCCAVRWHYPEVGVYPAPGDRMADEPSACPTVGQTPARWACCCCVHTCWPATPGHYDGVIAALKCRASRCPAFRRRADARPAIDASSDGRPADGRRRGGLAHRLLAGRRPGLQRRPPPRNCWRSSTCLPRRIRSSSRPSKWNGSSQPARWKTPSWSRSPSSDGATSRSSSAAAARVSADADHGGLQPSAGGPGTAARPARDAGRPDRLVAPCAAQRAERKRGRWSSSTSRPTPATAPGSPPVGVRGAVRDALGHEGPAATPGRDARQRRRAARRVLGNAALRRRCQRARRSHRRPRAARTLAAEIERNGARRRAASSATALHLRARRAPSATRSSRCSPAWLRRRPDAAAVREGPRRNAFSASPLAARGTSAPTPVLHFGTHGSLKFMPGKQTGLSGDCWLTARSATCLTSTLCRPANNPSEAPSPSGAPPRW